MWLFFSFGHGSNISIRSVYAVFRAAIRIINHTKRAALHRQLLTSVISTAPEEKLDDILATIPFDKHLPHVDCMVCSTTVSYTLTYFQYLRQATMIKHGGMAQVSYVSLKLDTITE